MRVIRTVMETTLFIGWFVTICFLAGCTTEQQKQPEVTPTLKNKVIAESRILATMTDDEKPGVPSNHATDKTGVNEPPEIVIEINHYGKGTAYIAKIGDRTCVVHNGKRGTLYDKIEDFTLIVSPNGQRVAYGAQNGDKCFVVVDGVEKGPFSDRGRIAFSPDSSHVAYDAKIDGIWNMYLDNVKNGSAISYYDRSVFNSDSTKLAYVEIADASDAAFKLVVSDLKTRQNISIPISDPIIATNPAKTVVAAVEKHQNRLRVFNFDFSRPDKITTGELYDEIKQVTFSEDGKALAYVAVKDKKSYIVLNDKREPLPPGDYPWPFTIRPDNREVGIFIVNTLGKRSYNAYLHQSFSPEKRRNKIYKEGSELTYSKDGQHSAYVAIQNEMFTIVIDGKEGPFFDRTVAPHFSPDGKFLVYRARQDGKRFVVIADTNGKTIKRLPPYERVFDTTFTEDGKSVAYGVVVGNQILWKVEKL